MLFATHDTRPRSASSEQCLCSSSTPSYKGAHKAAICVTHPQSGGPGSALETQVMRGATAVVWKQQQSSRFATVERRQLMAWDVRVRCSTILYNVISLPPPRPPHARRQPRRSSSPTRGCKSRGHSWSSCCGKSRRRSDNNRSVYDLLGYIHTAFKIFSFSSTQQL